MNTIASVAPIASAGQSAHAANPMWLRDLLRGVAEVPQGADREICGLSLDSRQVRSDELFIAMPGTQHDGRHYLRQAVENGASAVVCEKIPSASLPELGVPTFWVDGLGQRVSAIAARFYRDPSARMRVIGVTGTNGKTTCAYLLAQTLNQLGHRCALIGTLGYGSVDALAQSELTTADAVATQRHLAEQYAANADSVCVEASSHGLAQGRVNGVAFDIALLTNLSHDHLDYHRSMDDYADAKRRLFEFDGLQCAVLNNEDQFGRELRAQHRAARAITYGEGGDISARNLRLNENGICFDAVEETAAGETRVAVRASILGRVNVANLLAVIATLRGCDIDMNAIADALTRASSPPGRMELFRNHADQPAVVVDYAHTPDALHRALASLAELCRGKICVVFGCGGDRDREKRPQMGECAQRLAHRVVVTDDNPRGEDPSEITAQIVGGMRNPRAPQVQVIHARDRAIATAIGESSGDDIVLVAGKGHETTQTIGNRTKPMSDRELVASVLAQPPRGGTA